MLIHKLSEGLEPEISHCYGLFSDANPLHLAAQLNAGGFFRFRRERTNPSKGSPEHELEYALFRWEDAQNECLWKLLSNRPLIVKQNQAESAPLGQSRLFAQEKKPANWCALKGNHDFWLWSEGELIDPKLEARAREALNACPSVKTFQPLAGKDRQKLITTLPY